MALSVTTREFSTSRVRRRISGFTLVELIVVIILLSVLSVTAISRMVTPSAFEVGALADAILTQLRAGHQLAATRRNDLVSVVLDSDGGEWRLRVNSAAEGTLKTVWVDADSVQVTASSGAASALLGPGSPLALYYDSLGDLATVTIHSNAGAPDLGVALTLAGDSNRQICVYATGYAVPEACL